MMTTFTEMMRQTFTNIHNCDISFESIRPLALIYAGKFALLCMPILLVTAAVSVAVNVAQFGFKFTTKQMQPKLDKLNPLPGIANFFSSKVMVEAIKGVGKLLMVSYMLYTSVRGEFSTMANLAQMPPAAASAIIGHIIWKLFMTVWFALLVIAALDYYYQRRMFEKSIMMTKQEVKDEYKRIEGDPAIKGKIRARQREMARRRMMQVVPQADVVVVNPIHFAIAIKYDPSEMAAPIVVAKGQRLLAEKIKSIADANGVPIVENIQVARTLYKLVEVGDPVPEQLYQAVAEILAYVFRLNEKAAHKWKAAS